MNLREKLNKLQEEARTIGRQSVKVLDLTDSAQEQEANAIGEDNIIVIDAVDRSEIQFRTAVINKVENLGTVDGKDGNKYTRYFLLGRDTDTNATLRTWTIVEENAGVEFKIGDLAEFPCVHIPFGKAGFANDKVVVPLKKAGAYQHCSQATAEKLSAERVAGYQKAITESAITAQKASVGTV